MHLKDENLESLVLYWWRIAVEQTRAMFEIPSRLADGFDLLLTKVPPLQSEQRNDAVVSRNVVRRVPESFPTRNLDRTFLGENQ